MSTSLAVSTARPRLSDEELLVYDAVLKDVVLAHKRSRPPLKILGTHRRRRTQRFVVLNERTELPKDFDSYHEYEISSVQLQGSETSLRMMSRVLEILTSEGHHFDNLQIRYCHQADVLIYFINVKGDEPEL